MSDIFDKTPRDILRWTQQQPAKRSVVVTLDGRRFSAFNDGTVVEIVMSWSNANGRKKWKRSETMQRVTDPELLERVLTEGV